MRFILRLDGQELIAQKNRPRVSPLMWYNGVWFVWYKARRHGPLGNFIGYFSVAVVVIVIAVIFRILRRKSQKISSVSDRMNFIVRSPGIYRVTGIVCAAFFGCIFLISSLLAGNDPAYPFFTSVFIVFFAAGLFIAYYSFRWKLVVADNWLFLTPIFGNERKYNVREVTHIKTDPNLGIRAYSNDKKLFSVGSFSICSGMLVAYFIEKGVRAPEKINLPL